MKSFCSFIGVENGEELRKVTRAHVIAWRKDLENRELSASTIRRKLAALSSLYSYLCECNSVPHNPVDGVKRPGEGSNGGHSSNGQKLYAKEFLRRFVLTVEASTCRFEAQRPFASDNPPLG